MYVPYLSIHSAYLPTQPALPARRCRPSTTYLGISWVLTYSAYLDKHLMQEDMMAKRYICVYLPMILSIDRCLGKR